MRSRMIVTMSRYSTTSASSQMRPCPGIDVRSALLVFERDRELKNSIQCSDEPLHAAAVLQIDHRVAAGIEDVADAKDIRTAEQDDAVAVGVSCRHVVNDDRLTVE